MNISVSVIIVTYKQAEVLRLIIQGLNQQTYSGKIEIVVADDGSQGSVMTQNISVLKESRHEIKYVWHQDLGYRAATARNNGIRLSQNELLIFLDGDIVPHKELIERHVANHTKQNLLVAGNRTWIGELTSITTLAELESVIPDKTASDRGKKEADYRQKLITSQNPWRACFSANLSVKKTSLVLFDERFVGWGPEDAEFCYRLCVKNGFVPIYDETIGSYHLESPTGVGNVFRKGDHESIVNYLRNTFLFYDSCPGLKVDEVFYGLKRLKLSEATNSWSVISRSESEGRNLTALVYRAREWLTHKTSNH